MEMMVQNMSEIKKSIDWLDRVAAAARLVLTEEERARLRKKTAGMQKAGQEDSPAFRFYKSILLEWEDLENNADR
jgi:hypothetical protein